MLCISARRWPASSGQDASGSNARYCVVRAGNDVAKGAGRACRSGKVEQAPSALGAFTRHPATIAILALGITQIVAWGTTLYALGVLGKPIAADTGWSQTIVFGGLTIGLLVSSATSTFVGRLIDRRGGRSVMAIGSILVAVGLVLLALVPSIATYLAAWAFLGLAMRMTLYDAAFAALVQVTPSRGRRAISYLTLFGGFASSVFWPIGHALNSAYGWRTTLVIFAAINLLVCLPLHWFGLARRETEAQAEQRQIHGRSRRAGGSSARRCAARHRHGAVQRHRCRERGRVRRAGGAPGSASWRRRGSPRPLPSSSPRSRAWPRSWAASGT